MARFYERRARRLLPALGVVLTAVLVASALVLPPTEFLDLGTVVRATPLGLANVALWQASGYFAPAADTNAVVHLWSLAVEEQFYLVFPVALAWLTRRGAPSRAWGLAALTGVGFVGAAWAARHAPSAAFYLAPTRAWELTAGAALAAWPRTRAPAGPVAEVGVLAGLALIALAIATVTPGSAVPAEPLLPAVLGTVLVLACGAHSTWAARVLRSRPLVGIGLVSYSAYLWHQPLLALVRVAWVAPPPPAVILGAVALAGALAALSWRYVEQPARDPARLPARTLWRGVALGATACVAAGWWVVRGQGLPGRFPLTAAYRASLDRFYRADECYRSRGVRVPCRLGPASGDPAFIVLGDSHALAMLPGWDGAAALAGRPGLFHAGSGCLPFTGIYVRWRDERMAECRDLMAGALRLVRERRIRAVYLVAKWGYYTEGGYDHRDLAFSSRVADGPRTREESEAAVRAGLASTLRDFGEAGANVVIVEQVPWQRVDAGRVLMTLSRYPASARLRAIDELAVPRARHDSLRRRIERWWAPDAAAGRVRLLRLDDALCEADRCPFAGADEAWYADAQHLSVGGARRLVPTLAGVLRAEAPAEAGRSR
jgi:peptidoglycan/LPS O-acetylase OafA/YrhL